MKALIILAALLVYLPAGFAQTYTNPVGGDIRMGDPFVFLHDGRYYLYGTTAGDGFKAWTSTNLTDWEALGYAYRKTPDSWCGKTYWAPEVVHYRDRFYMVFSCQPAEAKKFSARVSLAVSDKPEGPFEDLHLPLFDNGFSAIDGHVFVDNDGQPYLYYARVGVTGDLGKGELENHLYGKIYAAPLKQDLSGLAGEPVLCLVADEEWEESKTRRSRAVEGTYVFAHEDRYFMTFSAGHYADPNYGIGYATAPAPLGPWTKSADNPIVAKVPSKGVSGPGHNSITLSPDGAERFMVYHAHADPERPSGARTVNIDRLVISADGRLRLLGPTRTPQPMPSGVTPAAPGHVDPWPVMRAAVKKMGVDKLNCITIAGVGYAGKVGQNVTQDTDWPLGKPLENYTRTINYEARSSVERFSRQPGLNPRSWKYGTGWLGGTPLQQNERQTFVVLGDHAWHVDGEQGEPIPAPADAELWQLDIWLTPAGFLKAAMAPGANPTAIWRWEMAESGRDGATTAGIEKVTIVSATVLGKYRVNATINFENLIPRIQTWVPHPVLGDMNYEHEYTEWKTVDGVMFPAGWHHHDGWDDERQIPTISGGHNGFGGSFPEIQVNACGAPAAVPERVRQATAARPRVEPQNLADGVWLLGGSSHNSVAVEFDRFVAVVEAPLDEQRSLAVIEEIVRLVPGKPIRFIVNTHAHYDHLGGLRTYLHVGATVITHQRNRVFYETELLNYVPRTLEPDMVSLHPPTELSEGYTMEDVDEKYIVSDGARNLEIYYVQGLASHVEGMLMAYLPKEKILIEADLYDPPAQTAPTAVHQAFYNNVRQLGLDVSTIAPIHGQPVPWRDFVTLVTGQ